MTLPVRARLFVSHALVAIAAVAIVTAFAVHEQRRWAEQLTRRSLEAEARRAAARLPLDQPWEAVAHRLGAELGRRVTLIDRSGRVRGDSEVPVGAVDQLANHADRPEVRAALEGRTGFAVRHSASLDRDLVYVAVPAPAGRPVVVLRVAEPAHVMAELDASLMRLSVVAAIGALLLSLPLLLWVTGRAAWRVRALERVALRLAAGERDARALEHGDDELGRLGRAINRMAAEARARLEALERERDERERILAHMTDGVALVDAAGRVVRMNRSLASLFGLPLPAGAGTPFNAFVRSPELDELIRDRKSVV